MNPYYSISYEITERNMQMYIKKYFILLNLTFY